MSTETDKLLNNLRPPLRIRRRCRCRWYHRRRLDRYRRLGCRCGGWLRWWRCRRIGLRGNLCHFGWSYRGGFGWFTKKMEKMSQKKNEGSQPESLKGKSNIAMEMSQMHSYRHPNTSLEDLWTWNHKPYPKPLSQEVFGCCGAWNTFTLYEWDAFVGC